MGSKIRPFLAFVLALVSACCACSAQAPAQSPSAQILDPIQDLKSKTVALVEPRELGAMLGIVGLTENHVYCSGVWVDQNTIVTANHCVEDLELGSNVFYSTLADVSPSDNDVVNTIHMAELLAVDPAHDLALVRVATPPAHATAPLARNVFVGERDTTMGHPLDLLWSYSEGLVSAVRTTGDLELDMTWVQSTAPISPGNSGGGLFNEQGELLGICSRGYFGKAENLNFYVHVDYVRKLMTVEQTQ